MPRIRIECALPFPLPLPDGDYADMSAEPLGLRLEPADSPRKLTGYGEEPTGEDRTVISSHFQSNAVLPGFVEAEKTAKAKSLMGRINRLIRWYRVVSSDAAMSEVTLSKASPFIFFEAHSNQSWARPLSFFIPPVQDRGFSFFTRALDENTAKVARGLASGMEPEVEELFLLDARQALEEGRFREAVLFSWSTIDAIFSRRFDSLVDGALADEWSESRKFLRGLDFGLRHKMTIGLRLVTRRSFFKEPAEFWSRLSSSYDRRNSIIHRGETASEIDAEHAIKVAEDVVKLMNEITAAPGSPA